MADEAWCYFLSKYIWGAKIMWCHKKFGQICNFLTVYYIARFYNELLFYNKEDNFKNSFRFADLRIYVKVK